MKIYLTVILKAEERKSAALKAALQNLVLHSRKEAACLQYDLFQAADDENTFIFQEIWQNQSGLDLHNEQSYIKNFQSGHSSLVSEQVVYKTSRIA